MLDIDPLDLKIEAYPPGPVGGMLVGTITNGVKVTHVPTGIVVTCTEHRSMHKNRAEAFKLLVKQLESRIKPAKEELEYIPKGGMCSICTRVGSNCATLPFDTMPVIEKYENLRVVRCTKWARRTK